MQARSEAGVADECVTHRRGRSPSHQPVLLSLRAGGRSRFRGLDLWVGRWLDPLDELDRDGRGRGCS